MIRKFMKTKFKRVMAIAGALFMCATGSNITSAYETGCLPSDPEDLAKYKVVWAEPSEIKWMCSPGTYRTACKDIVNNIVDSQENYDKYCDINKDGVVSFKDLAMYGYNRDTRQTDLYIQQSQLKSKCAILDIEKDGQKLIVKVKGFDADFDENEWLGFDYAILYNKENLKLDDFQWSDDAIENYMCYALKKNASEYYLAYRDTGDYVLMTGFHLLHHCYGKMEVATLTFTIINDSENIGQDVDIVVNASEFKENPSELKENTFKYVLGSGEGSWEDGLNLKDAQHLLGISLRTEYTQVESDTDIDFYDLTGDGKITLRDASVALKQALGIEPPIYLKWDVNTTQK